ncbi:MAG: hypothetical protein WDO74_25980 [Pseudomonadota bacterium]
MRAFDRKLTFPLLAGALGLLAWQFWPRRALPPAPNTMAPTSRNVVRETSQPAAINGTVVATDSTAARAIEPNDEAVLRQLEPLAISDKPRALDLALVADSQLPPRRSPSRRLAAR